MSPLSRTRSTWSCAAHGPVRRDHGEAAGHAQVDEQVAVGEIEEKVLAPPADAFHLLRRAGGAARPRGTGQRRRGSRTTTSRMRRPTTWRRDPGASSRLPEAPAWGRGEGVDGNYTAVAETSGRRRCRTRLAPGVERRPNGSMMDGRERRGIMRRERRTMANRWGGWAAALVAATAFSSSAAAQEGRASPPGRETAMFEFLLAEVEAQRGETGPALDTLSGSPASCATRRSRAVPWRSRSARARWGPPSTGGAARRARAGIDARPRHRGLAPRRRRRPWTRPATPSPAFVEASSAKPLLIRSSPTSSASSRTRRRCWRPRARITRPVPRPRGVALRPGRGGARGRPAGRRAAESKAALAIKPAWDQAAILKAQVLRKESPGGGDRVLPAPSSTAIPTRRKCACSSGASYAAAAADRRGARAVPRGRAARAQGRPHVPYAIGLLSLQLEDYADAQIGVHAGRSSWGYREPGRDLPRARPGRRGVSSGSTRRSTGTRRSTRATGCARS